MIINIPINDLPMNGCRRCKFFETYTLEERTDRGMFEQRCRHSIMCENAILLYKEDMKKLLELNDTEA